MHTERQDDHTPALIRHKSLQRLSINLDPDLRKALSAEAARGDGTAEAELVRDLLTEGLKSRGHKLVTIRRGRRQVVRQETQERREAPTAALAAV